MGVSIYILTDRARGLLFHHTLHHLMFVGFEDVRYHRWDVISLCSLIDVPTVIRDAEILFCGGCLGYFIP